MPITVIVSNNGPCRISVEDASLVRIEDAAGTAGATTGSPPTGGTLG